MHYLHINRFVLLIYRLCRIYNFCRCIIIMHTYSVFILKLRSMHTMQLNSLHVHYSIRSSCMTLSILQLALYSKNSAQLRAEQYRIGLTISCVHVVLPIRLEDHTATR